MAENERRREQRRDAVVQYGRRSTDVAVAQVAAAAGRMSVEVGAATDVVRDAWRERLREQRPDLGRVDGGTFARTLEDKALLDAVARLGAAARRSTPPVARRRHEGPSKRWEAAVSMPADPHGLLDITL